MWRAGLAVAVLLLAVISTSTLVPGVRHSLASATQAYPTPGRAAAGHPCWKDVLQDWVDNGRIEGVYARPCYQFALNEVTGGHAGLTLYGAGDLLNALEEGVRTRARP